MKIFTVSREQIVARPLAEVFEFFSHAGNLEMLTPAWLKFQILTPEPVAMRPGARIDYRIRYHGIPMRWVTEIEVWDPPHRFVDTQVRGPYKLWHHTHTFEETKDGTRIGDVVRYAMPFGPLGRVVNFLQTQREVESIFDYRNRQIAKRFPAIP